MVVVEIQGAFLFVSIFGLASESKPMHPMYTLKKEVLMVQESGLVEEDTMMIQKVYNNWFN